VQKKLQDYALVAEIASAVAVVISLIFVGLQIRQSSDETALSTNAIQVSAYQALAGDVMTLQLSIVENPQLLELVSRISEGGTVKSQQEQYQFDIYLSAVLEHGDMAYYQYEKGIIDEQRLFNIVGIVISQFSTDYARERWYDLLRLRVDPNFADYLENLLTEE